MHKNHVREGNYVIFWVKTKLSDRSELYALLTVSSLLRCDLK